MSAGGFSFAVGHVVKPGGQGNPLIAAGLGVSDKTVGAVRKDMERTAEIPQLKETQTPQGHRGNRDTSKDSGNTR